MLEFQKQQARFTAHLRNPALAPAPDGIEDRRLQIYRELFYNNIEGFLCTAFPVLRAIINDEHWHAMARDFYARHRNTDPLFGGLAKEFLTYLEEERGVVAGDPPFLAELAHYEWVELALSVAEDKLTPAWGGPEPDDAATRAGADAISHIDPIDPNGDLLDATPVVSPLAWTLAYSYPVHRISPEFQPAAASETATYLVVYRTRQDEVKFTEINAVTARLLALIEEQPQAAGRTHLASIADELGMAVESIVEPGHEMLLGLRRRDVILGTRRT